MSIVWRLIPLHSGPGKVQMAIDQWLFDQCRLGLHPPVLRFYTWSPAAISLGHHQREWPAAWDSLTWQGHPLDLVRRPTGGRAVLHVGDLTYSLVLTNQTGHRRQTYAAICRFLIRGWRSLGVTLDFGTAGRGYHRQANCFASATAADLVGLQGEKFIGSAQLWQGQTVLQHGSMQLQPDPDLWRQVFGSEIPCGRLSWNAEPSSIVEALTQAAAQHFQADFEVNPLTDLEWQAIYARRPN